MNIDVLKSYRIPSIEHDYVERDAILYALGVGYGDDPLDESQLAFIYEDGLRVVPSLVNTIAHPGFWIGRPELGIDWVKVLHAEQAFEILRPLPTSAKTVGSYEIVRIEDKGPEKGAIMTMRKSLTDRDSGELYAIVEQVIFLRGDGGQGGFGEPARTPSPLPDRNPDTVVDLPTLPQLALLYRLNGDLNPIHASPAVARKAGFGRPILHGLCTMGIATRALVAARCDNRPEWLRSLFVRFSKPVFPGETIRTEIFDENAGNIRFRCRSVERDLVVLDRGHAVIR